MSVLFNRAVLQVQLERGIQALALNMDAQQQEKLLHYLALLHKWNHTYNLTAVRDPAHMVTQHVLDSLAATSAFAHAQHVLDVGSGGGLPGMVLAIWAEKAQPAMHVTMVDTVHKKTAFLNQVKAELALHHTHIQTGRIEAWQTSQRFDIITSRAFASLADFIVLSQHLLQEGGMLVALKGTLPEEEMAVLPDGWEVAQIKLLHVPMLDAKRHLIFMKKT